MLRDRQWSLVSEPEHDIEPESLRFGIVGVIPLELPVGGGPNIGVVVSLQLAQNLAPRHRGVNIITLWMAAMAKGYTAPIWMTFKQAIDLGGCVRKGEKGSLPSTPTR
jgi:antirestriction protein ArdC